MVMLTLFDKDDNVINLVDTNSTYVEGGTVHYVKGLVQVYEPSVNVLESIKKYLLTLRDEHYINVDINYTNGAGVEKVVGYMYPDATFGSFLVLYPSELIIYLYLVNGQFKHKQL